MATPKGKIGYPVLGDSSLEFYRNVPGYLNSRIEEYGARIFQARILNKPTVLVCSASGIKELLTEHHSRMNLGYKAILHHLYGDGIMFEDAPDAERLHSLMHRVFVENGPPDFERVTRKYIERHFGDLHASPSVQVYSVFKKFATELMLALFLDLDATEHPNLVEEVSSLATTHWHGIISVPLSWKVSVWSSTYKRAVEAKDRLLHMIRERLANHREPGGFLERASQAGFRDQAEVEQHILPFLSALVPKAIASLLTSLMLDMCNSNQQDVQVKAREDGEYLDWCLLETERLWPPMLGGRRLVTQDFTLEGYKVPKGYGVIYVSSVAHRDPKAFKNPGSYDPSRWADNRKEQEKLLFSYGGGPRCCVGTARMRKLIKMVSEYILQRYSWTLVSPGPEATEYKWLPMARPREAAVRFALADQSGAP